MPLSKKEKRRIYDRCRKKFRRLGKRLGKHWKEISIDGKKFQEFLQVEIRKAEYVKEFGDDEDGFDPDRLKKEILERKQREEESLLEAMSREDFNPPRGMPPIWGHHENREKILKDIERETNEILEKACSKGICPRCKSSVCRCEDEEE